MRPLQFGCSAMLSLQPFGLIDDGTGRLAQVAVNDVDRTADVRTQAPEVDARVAAVSACPSCEPHYSRQVQ